MSTEKIGVLASGRGSNFKAILDHINLNVLRDVEVGVLVSDKPEAQALEIAESHDVPCYAVEPKDDEDKAEYEGRIEEVLKDHGVGLVVLAGFMRIVSPYLIGKYRQSIMNIHPSLLPSFKGLNAQKKALEHGVKVSGCTVHYVWDEIDSGPIILQRSVPVREDDTESTLADRILVFEHRILSKAIQLHANGRLEVDGRNVKIDYDGGWEEEWSERQQDFVEHQRESWKGTEVYREVFS